MLDISKERLSKVVVIFIIVALFSSGYYPPSFTLSIVAYVIFAIFNLRDISIKYFLKNILLRKIMIFFACLFIPLLFNYSNDNIISTINFCYYSIPMIMLLHIALKYNVKNTIKYMISFVIIIGFVVCLIQYFYFDIYRVYGLLKNANVWASFLGLVLPLAIYGAVYEKDIVRNTLFRIVVVLTSIMIIGTGTRGVILACLILVLGLTFYVLKIRNLSNKYLIFFIIVTILLLYKNDIIESILVRGYDINRISAYIGSFRMWMDKPIMGVGFANWSYMYSNYYMLDSANEKLKHAHNIYLQLLSTVGIVGLLGFIYFVGSYLKEKIYGFKLYRYNIVGILGVVIFLLHGLVDASLFVKSSARLFWLFLAIYQMDLFDENKKI